MPWRCWSQKYHRSLQSERSHIEFHLEYSSHEPMSAIVWISKRPSGESRGQHFFLRMRPIALDLSTIVDKCLMSMCCMASDTTSCNALINRRSNPRAPASLGWKSPIRKSSRKRFRRWRFNGISQIGKVGISSDSCISPWYIIFNFD